jgi:hypothetical protein
MHARLGGRASDEQGVDSCENIKLDSCPFRKFAPARSPELQALFGGAICGAKLYEL